MPTISMASIIDAVRLCNNECKNTSGMAVIKPSAVVFMATEILLDNKLAFCAGSALATAAKAVMRPIIVPSKPNKVAILAKVPSIGVTWGYHSSDDLLSEGAGTLVTRFDELEPAIVRLLE